MIEPAIIVVRLLQYAGAAILCGSPLFFVYAGPVPPGARLLVAGAAALLALASLAAIAAQAVLFAGSLGEGLAWESLFAIVTEMPLGRAALLRAGLALAALALLARRPSWPLVAALGTAAAASLAWLGHAGAADGALANWQIAADIAHVLAACAWLGALAGFVLLARGEDGGELHSALVRFSGAGSLLVAALLLTGVANAGFLAGADQIGTGWSTPWGHLLALKLGLFAAMLAFAANNRWRLTPRLARPGRGAVIALRRSVGLEAGLGLMVLAAVAWLGTLAPPAA